MLFTVERDRVGFERMQTVRHRPNMTQWVKEAREAWQTSAIINKHPPHRGPQTIEKYLNFKLIHVRETQPRHRRRIGRNLPRIKALEHPPHRGPQTFRPKLKVIYVKATRHRPRVARNLPTIKALKHPPPRGPVTFRTNLQLRRASGPRQRRPEGSNLRQYCPLCRTHSAHWTRLTNYLQGVG
jgi:hypothetical protein